jgi:hypothetical protein
MLPAVTCCRLAAHYLRPNAEECDANRRWRKQAMWTTLPRHADDVDKSERSTT